MSEPVKRPRYWCHCQLCKHEWVADNVGDCPACGGTQRVRDGRP